jgi:hypothetical protein
MLKLIVILSYNSIILGSAGFYISIFKYVVDQIEPQQRDYTSTTNGELCTYTKSITNT